MSVLALFLGVAAAEVQVSSLECVLDKGGLLAAATVVGALAKQQSELDACTPEGAAFAVRWTWGAVRDAAVIASSRPAADACIQSILQTTTSALSGQCTAVVLVGEPAAAAAAAAQLQATPTTP
jgi:hypothetical protein